MSTPERPKFVVYAPDKTDEGSMQRRLAVRQEHLQRAANPPDGIVVHVGGAMLTPESLAPDAETKMVGSIIIFEADNIDVVRKQIESDVYYKTGVWDAEELVILPFMGRIVGK
ncbi:hypothetical protein FB45DRAFT_1025035 [Roridomyces roridus]|uniref:YCII-related domain-containing protein n=1 Tax=Roridomyces roridus TaxID=1738132 RepID=A0AAD7FQE6_9AGAR|nr:hypothetical protein FB45DRAFT_1025035 [Roridomyces roridus]